MNQTQTIKQVFSTVQQIKLRQLQLEVESLEEQVQKALKVDKHLLLDKEISSSDSLIYTIKSKETR